MPKYLMHSSYTAEGVRGFLKEGGSSRRQHFTEIVGNLGGKVEGFYFAFGADDIYTIVDLPDNASGAALSLALNAGGALRGSTVVLLTPEEMDQAAKKSESVRYRPPGKQ
ncbi:MAG: GYD domain-containing protein [Chloroflexota bacterium]